ncbi:hypothetical protein DNTS_012224 [Danionella cerebrum]|uniref:Uncharacterized protein n=1 Tax=Danionella cerebrum TaxID=2873325 RepID=A0A553N259_9TELE|nr:hypothetical protein DNTS_012224 [Danionella translucida]
MKASEETSFSTHLHCSYPFQAMQNQRVTRGSNDGRKAEAGKNAAEAVQSSGRVRTVMLSSALSHRPSTEERNPRNNGCWNLLQSTNALFWTSADVDRWSCDLDDRWEISQAWGLQSRGGLKTGSSEASGDAFLAGSGTFSTSREFSLGALSDCTRAAKGKRAIKIKQGIQGEACVPVLRVTPLCGMQQKTKLCGEGLQVNPDSRALRHSFSISPHLSKPRSFPCPPALTSTSSKAEWRQGLAPGQAVNAARGSGFIKEMLGNLTHDPTHIHTHTSAFRELKGETEKGESESWDERELEQTKARQMEKDEGSKSTDASLSIRPIINAISGQPSADPLTSPLAFIPWRPEGSPAHRQSPFPACPPANSNKKNKLLRGPLKEGVMGGIGMPCENKSANRTAIAVGFIAGRPQGLYTGFVIKLDDNTHRTGLLSTSIRTEIPETMHSTEAAQQEPHSAS